jgi:dolichyl-phosphate-mannose-protein mannosyltransferase
VISVLDSVPAVTDQGRAAASGHLVPWRRARRYVPAWWPLAAVLSVQAALSLRLVWSNTAFQDEALYLRAGHLEWAHWLHGAPIPDFPAYFSGAPVLYPPIGALADDLGGLAAARILSLGLMLVTTGMLWGATTRLFGKRAAILAAALFATLAGSQFLGAFATFDALALMLLAAATWLGVRSAGCDGGGARATLLITAGLVLAAADAVKYATVLFTPIVVSVVAFAAWRRRPGGSWLPAAATVLGSWLVAIVAGARAGGHQYWLGITASTLDRPAAGVAASMIVQRAYTWMSLILVLAVFGTVLALASRERGKLLLAVLAGAALLAPAEQVRLHTAVSLQKHVVFGAWFAAMAAGYAMARLSRLAQGRGWAPVMAIPIVASAMFGSIGQATALYRAWPDSSRVVADLAAAIRAHPGNYLAEDYDVEAYYLRAEAPWQRWSSTYYFSYPGTGTGPAAYRAAIDSHYFALVILDFGDTSTTDRQIVTDMAGAGGYSVLAVAGPFTIWATHTTLPRGSRALR